MTPSSARTRASFQIWERLKRAGRSPPPPGISYRVGRIEPMIFTTKAEYGVRLLVELGRQASGQPVSLKAISEAEGLPLAYLERIVALLRKAALVESTRGAHGGYRLSRPAESITMDEV